MGLRPSGYLLKSDIKGVIKNNKEERVSEEARVGQKKTGTDGECSRGDDEGDSETCLKSGVDVSKGRG